MTLISNLCRQYKYCSHSLDLCAIIAAWIKITEFSGTYITRPAANTNRKAQFELVMLILCIRTGSCRCFAMACGVLVVILFDL